MLSASYLRLPEPGLSLTQAPLLLTLLFPKSYRLEKQSADKLLTMKPMLRYIWL